ncbi:MAG: hypothetical protein M1479_10620 [Actinobacteria bacterium]|nr:hypothetical protein [Actinomycetota bacterium]
MDKVKKALMIIATVAIVAIAGSMVYYFVFFKTGLIRTEKAQEIQQEQKIQNTDVITNSEVAVATTKAESEADKFNKEILDFKNFFKNYFDTKKAYEEKWSDIRSNNPTRIYTAGEISVLTNDELNAIKRIFDFPESVTKYIDYDLSYIKIRSKIWETLSVLPPNAIVDEYYPDFSKDLDSMLEYEDQKDNELRNILVNYNNRAKKLGISIPFPNK